MRLPAKLLAHLHRRGKTSNSGWVAEFRGCGVACVKKAWETARVEADLRYVTRHTRRHSAITRAMQPGVDMWQATGYIGVSMNTLERDYAHHPPD